MTVKRNLDKRVADNQRRSRRIESSFSEVSDQGRKDQSHLRNEFVVSTTLYVWRRGTGGGIISGHPNPNNGSGRGVSGDQRGEWELIVEEVVLLTRTGKQSMRDTLLGEEASIGVVGVGDGVESPTTGDEELVDETHERFAWGDYESNVGYGTGEFRVSDTISPREFGLFDGRGDLISRAVVDDLGTENDEELRVEFEFSITGDGRGSSVITDAGTEAIAEAFTTRDTFLLNRIAIGNSGTPFEKDDTSLSGEVYRKAIDRERTRDGVLMRTMFLEFEPEDGEGSVDQPFLVQEMGVFDNSGRLIWATTLSPEEKNEDVSLSVTIGFRFR